MSDKFWVFWVVLVACTIFFLSVWRIWQVWEYPCKKDKDQMTGECAIISGRPLSVTQPLSRASGRLRSDERYNLQEEAMDRTES